MISLGLWQVLGILLAIVVGLPVLTFLFQAGCALTNVPELGFFKALGLVVLATVLSLPLAGVFYWLLGAQEADPNAVFGPMHLLGLALGLIGSLLVSGVLYKFVLATSFSKGQLIAGFEVLLGALLTTLVAAVALVVLAGVQILKRAEPKALGPTAPAERALVANFRP
jgi:hypothetical protein